jgi:hypothetical protein
MSLKLNKILADFKRQADIAKKHRIRGTHRFGYVHALTRIKRHLQLKETYENRLKKATEDPFFAKSYEATLQTEKAIIEKYEQENYEKDKSIVRNYITMYGRPVTNNPEKRAKESNEVRRARTEPKINWKLIEK